MSKSITIHKLDDSIAAALEYRATKNGLSLNKTIKNILKKDLKKDIDSVEARRKDFEEFSGKWTKKDFDQFQESMKDFEKIDWEEW